MIRKEGGSDSLKREQREQNIIESISDGKMISLYIEPSSICNFKCKFCDFHYNPKPHFKGKGNMSMDTYSKVVSQLKELHFKYKNINLFLHGESLVNKNLVKMIRIAKKEMLSDNLTLTTNGTFMSPEKLKQLVDAGITTILVSLDSIDKQYFKQFKGSDKLDITLKNIDYALHHIPSNVQFGIKCTTSNHSNHIQSAQSDKVIERFKDIVQDSDNLHIHIKNEISWPDQDKKLQNPILTPCELPFYQTVINFDGSVTSCCADITNSLMIGNVYVSHLKEIINSPQLKEIQKSFLIGNPPEICRHCMSRSMVNFDNCKDTLLGIITNLDARTNI